MALTKDQLEMFNKMSTRIEELEKQLTEAKAQATEHMLRRQELAARMDEIYGVATSSNWNLPSALHAIVEVCEQAGV